MNHGTRSAYVNHGCRCDPCKKAQSDYGYKYRSKHFNLLRLVDGRWTHPRAKHGTQGAYTNLGCRCVACTEAHRLTSRKALEATA